MAKKRKNNGMNIGVKLGLVLLALAAILVIVELVFNVGITFFGIDF